MIRAGDLAPGSMLSSGSRTGEDAMTGQPPAPWRDDDVERRRQSVLRSYGLLDDHHRSRADIRSLVSLAAASSGVPMAAINLLTENHQHQVESVGFAGSTTARADSMCSVVIDDPEPVVLADAREDERFKANPWVVGPASVRFYATFQLRTPGKVAIGSLCLFDTVPHVLDADRQEVLALLAARVTDVLELELRGRQWQAAARDLEAVNARLADFAATVSHDLRGPLSTVRLALDMLEDGGLGPEDAAFGARDLVARAQRSTVRMASTIEHLLESASSADTDRVVSASWRQVAADAVEDLGQELAGLDLRLDPDDRHVRCRPVGLRLALQNLVANAARYAGPLDPRIELRCHEVGERTEILVVDHGPGISPADAERVFAAGERGDATPGAAGDPDGDAGYGIGLATSRRLVSDMGGRLELRDTAGGGATFVVSLPTSGFPAEETSPSR